MPPLEMVVALLLQGVLPAAGVAALVFALVRGSLGKGAARAAAVLAVAAGFAEANVLDPQLPWWPWPLPWSWTLPPPPSPWSWTLLLLALVGLVEMVFTLPGVPVALALSARLVVAGVVAWWVAADVWTLSAFALVLFASWQLLEHRLRDLPAGLSPLLFTVIFCGGAAAVLIHSGTLRYTTAVVFQAAALLGVAAAALSSRDDGRGVAGVAVVLPLLLLLLRWNEGSPVPGPCFLLVGLAPLALLLTYLPPLRNWSDFRRGLAGMALVLVPVLVAVVWAAVVAPLPNVDELVQVLTVTT